MSLLRIFHRLALCFSAPLWRLFSAGQSRTWLPFRTLFTPWMARRQCREEIFQEKGPSCISSATHDKVFSPKLPDTEGVALPVCSSAQPLAIQDADTTELHSNPAANIHELSPGLAHPLGPPASAPTSESSSVVSVLVPILGSANAPGKTSRTISYASALSTHSQRAIPAGDAAQPISPLPESSCLDSNIFPLSPEWSERYDRRHEIEKISPHYVVKPMTRQFVRDDTPLGWVAYEHPEGSLYFFNQQRKIITDAYLCDPVVLHDLEAFASRIEEIVRWRKIQLPSHVQLVMQLTPAVTVDEMLCGYYFVDHTTRSLFWLEDFEADHILRYVRGPMCPSHIRHQMESQYWKHREYFPGLCDMSQDTVDELRGIFVHAITDALTSDLSLAPYPADKLISMLALVNEIKVNTSIRNQYLEFSLSRFMSDFARQRFINFHGQKCARLNRNQSIHGEDTRKRTLAITVLSPLLFFAPDVHMRALDNMYVDYIIRETHWKEFMEKLNQEWQDFLLLGEVLLTVNVSLLAIPTIAPAAASGNSVTPDRSLPEILSYISIVVTVGSIIMGLLLVRQNRTKNRASASEASGFLRRMESTALGLETIAIMYSLPWALLMWGMVTFIAAFVGMCLAGTDLATRASIAASSAAVLALVCWCIVTAWETRESFWGVWWSGGREFFEEKIHAFSGCIWLRLWSSRCEAGREPNRDGGV